MGWVEPCKVVCMLLRETVVLGIVDIKVGEPEEHGSCTGCSSVELRSVGTDGAVGKFVCLSS